MNPDDLQKQLAKLMQVVSEEQALRKEAERVRQQAKAQLAKQRTLLAEQRTAPTVTTVATTQKGNEILVPDKFNGTWGLRAEVYASQIG
jgi:type II secretory pathway pseudopilin PulG